MYFASKKVETAKTCFKNGGHRILKQALKWEIGGFLERIGTTKRESARNSVQSPEQGGSQLGGSCSGWQGWSTVISTCDPMHHGCQLNQGTRLVLYVYSSKFLAVKVTLYMCIKS